MLVSTTLTGNTRTVSHRWTLKHHHWGFQQISWMLRATCRAICEWYTSPSWFSMLTHHHSICKKLMKVTRSGGSYAGSETHIGVEMYFGNAKKSSDVSCTPGASLAQQWHVPNMYLRNNPAQPNLKHHYNHFCANSVTSLKNLFEKPSR